MPSALPPLPEIDRPAVLAALRARLARLGGGSMGAAPVPLCPAIDQALPGGGLARAALHEVLAGEPGAAAGFCTLALARAARRGDTPAGSVVWIASGPESWPPSLGRFGLSPAELVLVQAPRREDALWAMEEALRCPGIAGALLAVGEACDPASAQRLQVAAEAGGGLGLLLRPDGVTDGGCGLDTRWRVEALAGAGAALGDPRWRLELLRGRAGPSRHSPSRHWPSRHWPSRHWEVCWRSAAERLDTEQEEEEPAAPEPGELRQRPGRAPRKRG